MEKFKVTDHGHCIIKEELIISDSNGETDVEKVDEEIYSNPTDACIPGNSKQTTQDLNVESKNVESNAGELKNSTDSTNNQEPKVDIKTAECDIETLTKNLAKSFCKKCRKESPVIRRKARCNKCKIQLSYVCHACDNTYSTITELGYHLEMKHMKFPMIHSCTICSKTFTHRKLLLYHRRNKHNTYHSLHCSVCDKKFSRSVNKVLHEKVCGKQEIYKCEQCSFTADFKSNLANHILEKHSGFKEKCENCPKVFTNPRSLKRHMKVYCKKTKILECDHCGHKVCRKVEMIKHLDQSHMNGYNSTNSNSDEKLGNRKTCHDCGLTLSRQERMESHLIRCKLGLSFISISRRKGSRICKYCGESMMPREPMRYHVERCESAPLALRYTYERAKLPDMDTAIKKLAIAYCVNCKTKETLKYRLRLCGKCKEPLRFACVGCPKNFVDSKHLRLHLHRKHVRNLKFYRCDKCHCSYNRKKNLTKHLIEVHSDNPPTNYKCDKCGKEYKRRDSLRNHLISCGQEPKFYCDKCPYKTHFKSGIISHIWAKRSTCI